jgi:hypothetical protein
MTVEIAGIWEQGWNVPWSEFDLWEMVAIDFGVDSWAMTPVSGIVKGSSGLLREYADLADVLAETTSTVVWVDEGGETSLDAFVHPDDALYVFGRTSLRPMPGLIQEGHLSVKFATVNNMGMLWAHQALALVLYDRMVKSWQ